MILYTRFYWSHHTLRFCCLFDLKVCKSSFYGLAVGGTQDQAILQFFPTDWRNYLALCFFHNSGLERHKRDFVAPVIL